MPEPPSVTAPLSLSLHYDAGLLRLRGGSDATIAMLGPGWVWDHRRHDFCAPASAYARTVLAAKKLGLALTDQARAYSPIDASPKVHREPRPYQAEAIKELRKNIGQGVVVLPTGAGKTHVAVMAIEQYARSTLVVAPTLDLVSQWYELLSATFNVPVGIVGGGEHRIELITVTTYDSAYIHMERIGNRFGIVIFDECHHLPSESYALAAAACLAPYRLGLTATPERSDGKDAQLVDLIGPTVFRRDIVDLSGNFLADYETVRIAVQLSDDERQAYEEARAIYRGFIAAQNIRMADPGGWNDFIQRSSRNDEGRRAMKAYLRQRELAFSAPQKIKYVERLLGEHNTDRVLIFTQDNATCYRLSREFLIPSITHHTKIKERADILRGISEGRYGAVVTSKVLNEGVDIPDANVAIIVSGSGSVREHVQRLGRVLRKRDGKFAVLYELVTAQTGEAYTSDRRREHSAYGKGTQAARRVSVPDSLADEAPYDLAFDEATAPYEDGFEVGDADS